MADSTPNSPEPRYAEVLGRTIAIKHPNEVQGALIMRHGRVAELAVNKVMRAYNADPDVDVSADEDLSTASRQALTSTGDILNIIERLIVTEADREFVTEAMVNGDIGLDEINAMLDVLADAKKKSNGRAKRVR